MLSFASSMREAARSALPQRAFLRRARGEALFVSDAPRQYPETDWAPALEGAGFLTEARDGLLYLTPGGEWLDRLEARYADPPDALCAALYRFRGLPVEPESLALFALGARLLEGEANDGRFERRLRQRAAECMRLDGAARIPTRGGGLYACAAALYLLKEATI